MGYRSDVRIRIKATDFERLVKLYEEAPEIVGGHDLFNHTKIDFSNGVKKAVKDCANCDIVRYEEDYNYTIIKENGNYEDLTTDCVYFGWNDVKWYDDYEDVSLIMNFLEDCECYAYARIGEDYNDLENHERNFDSIFMYSGFSDDEY